MGFGTNRSHSPDIFSKGDFRLTMIAARQRLNLSQQELADKVHMSRSLIALYECGKAEFSLRNAMALAKVLCIEDLTELEEKYNYIGCIKGEHIWEGSLGHKIKVKA